MARSAYPGTRLAAVCGPKITLRDILPERIVARILSGGTCRVFDHGTETIIQSKGFAPPGGQDKPVEIATNSATAPTQALTAGIILTRHRFREKTTSAGHTYANLGPSRPDSGQVHEAS